MSLTPLTREAPAPVLPGVPLVGRGYCADVYAWGDGRVLKLFHGSSGPERAEREFRATRTVHAAGLPAPAAFELVEINGQHGLVMERIDGPSMFDAVQKRPWTLFAAVRQLAELHARINRLPAPAGLPTLHDCLARRIAVAEVSDAEREAARRQLAALPDGAALCHGDFHPGNVLLGRRGPVVIDWGAASRGHPLGDLACTSRLLTHAPMPSWAPGYVHLLMRCTRGLIHRSYLNRYLRLMPGTRRELRAWEAPVAAAARGWRVG